jgi:DNA-binding MarR family transcriptional regulator
VTLDRAGNLLGTLALVIADRTADAVDAAAGSSPSAASALSALLHFLDAPSVDLLRQVLGLTSSGTVRLVDRLEQMGYVQRSPGRDGRSTSVTLTAAGRRAAQRISAARAEVLNDALGVLSAAEREEFEPLIGKVLAGLVRGPGAVRWLCRMCDTGVCGREEGKCPVANAARERYLLRPPTPA